MSEMTLEQVRDQLREWGKVDHSPLCVNGVFWADAIDADLQSRAPLSFVDWKQQFPDPPTHPRDWYQREYGKYKESHRHAAATTGRAQGEAVAWFSDEALTDKSATTYDPKVAERWRNKGWPVTPLYTAPPAAVVTDESSAVAALREIVREPIKPWPDPYAHSHEAFARAVHETWCKINRLARVALATPAEPSIPVSKVREMIEEGCRATDVDDPDMPTEIADRILAEYTGAGK